jgi:hypothetical protein
MIELIKQPWSWYIAGPAIGLMVPLLLLVGNKHFGVSSSLRHICSTCIPISHEYFTFKKEEHFWNLVFVLGLVIGGYLASTFLSTNTIDLNPEVIEQLKELGITDFSGIAPTEIFGESFLSAKGVVFLILGGFLVGFGTRYANGCTSGHTIMGISLLNRGSMLATAGFFVGGLVMTHFLLPLIMEVIK